MLPQVFFPALTMCGTDKNCLGGDESYVTFKARDNQAQNGLNTIYCFNAYEDVMQRIKRMNLHRGSQIQIFAEMRTYIDDNNTQKFSFTVSKIDYIRTNSSSVSHKNEKIENEKEKSNLTEPDMPETKKDIKPVNTEEKKVSAFVTGELDLDLFQKMF